MPSAPQGQPIVITNVSGPAGLAVDALNLYVATYEVGPVYRVPLDGSAVTTLDPLSASTIAIDATRVYTVSDGGQVIACAKTGCGGNYTVLASGQDEAWGIAVDDVNVYWSRQSAGASIAMVPLAGGTPTTLVSTVSATSIVAAGGTVFFTGFVFGSSDDHAHLMSVPAAGGTPTVIIDGPESVSSLTADAQNLYFLVGTTLEKMPIAGGSPTTLATDAGGFQLALDAANVYFAGASGIESVPIAGGPVTTIVAGQGGSGLAVDANSVYWTATLAGTVMKAALR